MLSLLLLTFILAGVCADDSEKPHMVMIIADDLGYAGLGYNTPEESKSEVLTPTIDDLALNQGIRFSRAYGYLECGPSRTAFQSGRDPVHVTIDNTFWDLHNPANPDGGFQGMARSMTGLGTKLTNAGYLPHLVGKWDAGAATRDHIPTGRGYKTSFGYLGHYVDYWEWTYEDADCGHTFIDCWENDAPCTNLEFVTEGSGSGETRAGTNMTVTDEEQEILDKLDGRLAEIMDLNEHEWQDDPAVYEKQTWLAARKNSEGEMKNYQPFTVLMKAIQTIRAHPSPDIPFFLNYNLHLVHSQLNVPLDWWMAFDFVENDWSGDWRRRLYDCMLAIMDTYVGLIVDELIAAGLWDNTLLVFQADNGGSTYPATEENLMEDEDDMLNLFMANNYPLRGGKLHVLEGGIRTVGFAAGPYLVNHANPERIGSTLNGLAHMSDWHRVFVERAGGVMYDQTAADAGLPPTDGHDLWDYMIGVADESPRQEFHVNEEALIVGDYKIIFGTHVAACLSDLVWPNDSPPCYLYNNDTTMECGDTGCLFNIVTDASESNDLAADEDYATVLEYMADRLNALNEDIYEPDRGDPDPQAVYYAQEVYGGYWGPFVE